MWTMTSPASRSIHAPSVRPSTEMISDAIFLEIALNLINHRLGLGDVLGGGEDIVVAKR